MKKKNELLLVFGQISESAIAAFSALRSNMVRTFLSTLGITIGIFCIIMVLSIVDSLEKNLQDSVDSLGKDVAIVEKWPWEFGPDYKWWQYMNRPNPTVDELKKLEEQITLGKGIALSINLPGAIVKYKSLNAENVSGMAVSQGYPDVRDFELDRGRFFTENESKNGEQVVLIGSSIAENLFPTINPLEREISVKGKKFRVIGVFKKEGESMIGNSMDNVFIIPVTTAASYVRLNSNMVNSRIQIKAKDGITVDRLENELKGVMRSIRKLRPNEEVDFAINKTTLLSKPLKGLFSVVSLGGWIIGLFAILVGGFGIANIMFVSVKERTQQIGIQKSLGAKNYFILIEFLVEAIVLCLVGGAIGLVSVYGITLAVKSALDLNLFLSSGNIITGILVSVSIGIVSGFIPAYTASKLDPVEAIRAK
ncbi:MAG: ABC transporter [Bacteroidetes bacterium B1(2017)]|nr:MAG: ABC transporter [Bacteroidetes bacterium B1(2017)]